MPLLFLKRFRLIEATRYYFFLHIPPSDFSYCGCESLVVLITAIFSFLQRIFGCPNIYLPVRERIFIDFVAIDRLDLCAVNLRDISVMPNRSHPLQNVKQRRCLLFLFFGFQVSDRISEIVGVQFSHNSLPAEFQRPKRYGPDPAKWIKDNVIRI